MGVSPSLATGDTHDLAVALAPALRTATAGALSDVEWFRSRWQRGGAATGFAAWTWPDGTVVPVFIKLPVAYVEYHWTTQLGAIDRAHWDITSQLPVPRVVAHGLELAGYDLAWIITERFEGKPLAAEDATEVVHDILRTAADFQAAAMKVAPLDVCPLNPDWDKIITSSKEIARAGEVEDALHWKDLLRRVLKALPVLKNVWRSRPINAWCHGDLHAGNVMRRRARTDGANPCALVDLALVHPGHWLEDALYLERQHWGHRDLCAEVKFVSELAQLRRVRSLPVDEHYPHLANVRRVLMAACAPAMRDREGDRAYLHGALTVLKRALPQAVRECGF